MDRTKGHKTTLFLILVLALLTSGGSRAQTHEMGDADVPSPQQFAVKLEDGRDPEEVAREHGFINLGPVANLKNYFLFEAHERHRGKREVVADNAQRMSKQPHVLWMEEQVPKQRVKRGEL